MERKSELTKALLGEKFKELVAKKGFEKLTIKIDHGCSRSDPSDIL